MSFLGKHNPRANGKSVIVAACWGSLGGVMLATIGVVAKGFPGGQIEFAVAQTVMMAILGAFVAAVYESQVPPC